MDIPDGEQSMLPRIDIDQSDIDSGAESLSGVRQHLSWSTEMSVNAEARVEVPYVPAIVVPCRDGVPQ